RAGQAQSARDVALGPSGFGGLTAGGACGPGERSFAAPRSGTGPGERSFAAPRGWTGPGERSFAAPRDGTGRGERSCARSRGDVAEAREPWLATIPCRGDVHLHAALVERVASERHVVLPADEPAEPAERGLEHA